MATLGILIKASVRTKVLKLIKDDVLLLVSKDILLEVPVLPGLSIPGEISEPILGSADMVVNGLPTKEAGVEC